MNQSKNKQARYWKKWRESGAVGSMATAYGYSYSLVLHILHYNYDLLWYDRKKLLEALGREGRVPLIRQVIDSLLRIAHNEDHPINQRIATNLLISYGVCGDFTQSQPYQDFLAEQVRLEIQLATSFGYVPDAIWYDRLRALEHFSAEPDQELFPEVLEDFRTIAQKDDDWRIRKLAEDMLRSHEVQGDFYLAPTY